MKGSLEHRQLAYSLFSPLAGTLSSLGAIHGSYVSCSRKYTDASCTELTFPLSGFGVFCYKKLTGHGHERASLSVQAFSWGGSGYSGAVCGCPLSY